jgi:hypothetical protein
LGFDLVLDLGCEGICVVCLRLFGVWLEGGVEACVLASFVWCRSVYVEVGGQVFCLLREEDLERLCSHNMGTKHWISEKCW